MSFKKYGGRQFRSANNIILSQHGTFYNQLVPTKVGDENIVSKVYTDLYVGGNLTVNGTFYMQTFLTDDLHVTGFAVIDKDLSLGQQLIFSDNSVQISAFSADKDTLLSDIWDNTQYITSYPYTYVREDTAVTITNTVLSGNIDTNSISIYAKENTSGSIIFASTNTGGSIVFPDETVQTTAYKPINSSNYIHDIFGVPLPKSNGNANNIGSLNLQITTDTNKLYGGMYCIDGVLSVYDINEVKRMLYFIKIVSSDGVTLYTSPTVGIQFEYFNDIYLWFIQPIYWSIYLDNIDGCFLWIYIDYAYTNNETFEAQFDYRILKLS